jgi:hypothetical protein
VASAEECSTLCRAYTGLRRHAPTKHGTNYNGWLDLGSILRAGGLDDDLLQWMIFQGHLEHRIWWKRSGQSRRPSAVVGAGSCFQPTRAGLAFAHALQVNGITALESSRAQSDRVRFGRLTPHYDSTNNVLTWGGVVR